MVENPHASERLRISLTDEDSEDAGFAPGWSIGNVSKLGGIGETLSDSTNSLVMQIGIKGELVPAVSTDATLSNLEIYASASALATLSPTFDSDVTEYTTTVANEHTSANIEATRNDANATIEFLDKDDTTIPISGITNQNSWIIPSLDVGENIFKIKVTAEDTTTTKSYQVTITRSAAAPDAPASLTATPGNTQVALAWTAPAYDGGAAITKYQYRVSVDGGSTWSPDWTDVPDADSDSDQADERTVTLTSRANGTLHTFQVRAVNSIGGGSEAQDTATPVAFLVSNVTSAASGTDSYSSDDLTPRLAIQFITGTHTLGYKIDTVRLWVQAVTGTTPRVSIYSDSSGRPGSSLKILDNPGTIPTSFAWIDFDANSLELKPNTPYWIVLDRTSGSDQFEFRTTDSTAEDPGTAAGWSIGDSLQSHNTGLNTWNALGGSSIIRQMTIRGEPVTPTAPDAPASLTATPGNTQVALAWTAPASDGGAAITKYQYRVSDDGGTTWSPGLDGRARLRQRQRPGRRADGDGDGPDERHPAHLPGARGEQRGGRQRGSGHRDAGVGALGPGRAGVADGHPRGHGGWP